MYVSDNALAERVADRLWMRMMAQGGPAAVTAQKAAGTPPDGNYGHGPGGLFGNPALERPLYSAVIATPFSGLQYVLPVRGTETTDPLFGIITGVTDTSGDEASGLCDDPPTTGLVKLCQHTFPLGLFARQTPVYNIREGTRLASRGEHRDFQVFGNPFARGGGPFAPTVPTFGPNDVANTNSGKVIYAWMVAWARDFARILYTGTPVNNSPGRGYKEFYGFDTLINTGYRDAESGQACAAADSIVKSFANQNVRTNSSDIVTLLLETYFVLMDLAARVNLAPVRWVIAMSQSLFYEITRIWPCSYLTDGCAFDGNDGKRVNVDAGDQIRMRDEMRGNLTNRTGQHLKMFGMEVPVIIDDAITEDGLGAGVMSSSIYFVPLTVLNGQPVTYLEYIDYNAIGVPADIAKFAPADNFTVTDNGRFLVHKKPPTNLCVQLAAWTEPRLIMLTPYLAARIDNVAYNRLPNLRSGFPDSEYFVNGGAVNRNAFAPSYYSPTS